MHQDLHFCAFSDTRRNLVALVVSFHSLLLSKMDAFGDAPRKFVLLDLFRGDGSVDPKIEWKRQQLVHMALSKFQWLVVEVRLLWMAVDQLPSHTWHIQAPKCRIGSYRHPHHWKVQEPCNRECHFYALNHLARPQFSCCCCCCFGPAYWGQKACAQDRSRTALACCIRWEAHCSA